MTAVWTGSRCTGTDLLMLLALADFSDDDGNSFPSVATLAAKCRMRPRNANYILSALQSSGELEVHANEGWKGSNRYRIVLGALSSSGVQGLAGGMQSLAGVQRSAGVQAIAPTPAKDCAKPLQRIAPKPSLNRQEPSEGACTRKSRRKACTPVPENFGISAKVAEWARRQGVTRLEEHLEAFRLKAEARGYEYADWDAAFKNAVRQDWAGLSKAKQNVLHADDDLRAA
jgi:hypothetical protein